MTILHDRLEDLAEDAPAALPVPDLWQRGVRYRRRRRTGTAVVISVAAAALVVLGSVTWLRSPAAVEPLPANSPGGMPDRLYAPSPWLPGTDGAGPLGIIASLIGADRGHWTGTQTREVVGVSATTGEYRFLDLPDLAPHAGELHDYALSPDGRWVAYLYRDSHSDAPDRAATGLALYDAATGAVRRQPLPGQLGITSDRLLWAGSDVVVLSYGSITDQSGNMSVGQPLEVWNVHVDGSRTLPDSGEVDDVLGAGPGFVVVEGRHTNRVIDVGTGVVLRTLSRGRHGMTLPVFDRHANRFAVVLGNQLPHVMSIGTPAATTADPPTYEQVPGSEGAFAAYAWIDDNHLAMLQRRDPNGDRYDAVVDKVDVTTGATSRLVSYDGPDLGFDRQLATDLLSSPTTHAVEPPHPVDPRKAAGVAGVIVLTAGWALITWRRRVRT
jgi:hypothetical protein